ncbi:MAG: hypothetical protein AAFW69_12750, partial [Pseudomonadota bacterium]
AIEGALTGALTQANMSEDGVAKPLNPAQTAFVKSASTELSRFLAEGGTIAVTSAPAGEVWLNQDTFEDLPLAFLDLEPRVAAQPLARQAMIDTALLSAAVGDPASLSAEDQLTVGVALVTGEGAPRAVALGAALLAPLAETGNAEAAAALAGALAAGDPEAAYRHALHAAAGGAVAGLALLDQIEGRLETADVLALQSEVAEATGARDLADAPGADLATIRAKALDHLTGSGAVRDYALAYLWASLGAAAGDAASASVRDEIDGRMRFRGAAAADAWADSSAEAAEGALQLWIENDLATRLSGR